jgi:hypothetical protein
MHPLDRTATALHEIVELHQMQHFGKTYDDAHEVASATERPFRRALLKNPPKKLDTKRVAAAYRAYLKNPGKHPVIDRPNDLPRGKSQMDREIAEALERRRSPRPA